MSTSSSLKLTHQSACLPPPALLPSVQHHPAASRLSAPNPASAATTCACSSLPPTAMPSLSTPLVWPVIRHGIAFCSRAADRRSTTRRAQFNLRAALGNARCLDGGCRFPMRSQCVDDPDSSQPNKRRRWESGDHEPSASAHGAFGAGHGSHRQSTRAKQRLFGPVLSPVPRPVSPGRACPESKRGVRSADGLQRIKKAARSGTPADSPPSLRTSHEPLTK